MELISDYMLDTTSRHALNALTRKTFGFDFEGWVTKGYFAGDYIPLSFVENGKVISNASANIMDFIQNGKHRRYIQMGTVMTDEAYRNRGLAARLIKHIVNKYADECDGIYLFANLSALDFYRKAGFSEGVTEYRPKLKHTYALCDKNACAFMIVDENDADMKQRYIEMLKHSALNSALEQVNRCALQLFYTSDMENVYYAKDIDCFAVISREDDNVTLESIVCPDTVSLKRVIERIDMEYKGLYLGFSPRSEDASMFDFLPYDGADDYRLFYMGDKLESIAEDKLIFPLMSHA